MTPIEVLFRWAIYARFGRDSSAADVITDYLDVDPPDYRAAWRAWRDIARWHRRNLTISELVRTHLASRP